jgi:hypothetical protein
MRKTSGYTSFGTRPTSSSYVRLAPYGRLPLAVARVCRWTWSCADDGDDHANSAGYAVIARTVARLVDRRRAGREAP